MKNRLKKIKGTVPHIDIESYEDDAIHSPFLAALANPDILSDEDSQMFPERDFDAEEARAEYIEKFKQALTKLTQQQWAVIDSLNRHGDQQKVADELGIARSTVAVTLLKIQKKITKAVNKMQK